LLLIGTRDDLEAVSPPTPTAKDVVEQERELDLEELLGGLAIGDERLRAPVVRPRLPSELWHAILATLALTEIG
jgi:hypothetical protein